MAPINIVEILLAFAICVPSAVIGFGVWLIQRRINARAAEEDRQRTARQHELDLRDEKRRENEFMTWQTVNASLALSEATARAVQRIPDAHCNGDMDAALKYVEEIKRKQKNFMAKASIDDIYRDTVYDGCYQSKKAI